MATSNPRYGEIYTDTQNFVTYIYTGSKWIEVGQPILENYDFKKPSQSELEKYPALKHAWEEFLLVKNLVGI